MKKVLLVIFALLVVFLIVFGHKYFGANTGNFTGKKYLYIKTGSTMTDVVKNVQENDIVKNVSSFESVANQLHYADNIHPGKYEIKEGMGNWAMVRMLKAGRQIPVKLVLKKYRIKKDLISKICSETEADSTALKNLLNNNAYLKQYQLDSNSCIAAFMPNTYEMYWNTDAKKVFEKIVKAYTKYWTDANKASAAKQNLTPAQAMTLASIIDEESNKDDEKANIASVYLNRLKKGMKLQADPTARYAHGDFTVKRILTDYTKIPSSYNTYYVTGLPIGPICTPTISSIEAAIHPATTNYLFFCAKEDFSGHHNFASTNAEHEINAKKFHDAMNARGIKK